MIVMLHGCTQSPDDFAAGTRMNALAEERQCFVLYPAQTQSANRSRCWNWFKRGEQRRDKGEPAIIGGMTRDVTRRYGIDAGKVYVAGLSAGGAMAAVMGAAYPDLYAAVGVHSGVPVGSAHDLPSAFAAMRGAPPASPSGAAAGRVVPAIVFHGDRDATVHPRNGEQVISASVGRKRGIGQYGFGGTRSGARWPRVHAHGAFRSRRTRHSRALAGARSGPCVVRRERTRLLHGSQGPGCFARDAALFPALLRGLIRYSRGKVLILEPEQGVIPEGARLIASEL